MLNNKIQSKLNLLESQDVHNLVVELQLVEDWSYHWLFPMIFERSVLVNFALIELNRYRTHFDVIRRSYHDISIRIEKEFELIIKRIVSQLYSIDQEMLSTVLYRVRSNRIAGEDIIVEQDMNEKLSKYNIH